MGSSDPPRAHQRNAKDRVSRKIIGFSLLIGGLLIGIGVLKVILGWGFYRVPTGSMEPAICPGDVVVVEGCTVMVRRPHKGDLIAFRSDGIASLPEGAVYIRRIAGEPGDRLRIVDGKLYVNDIHTALVNSAGEIRYENRPQSTCLQTSSDTFSVPDEHLFVLGDKTETSKDSRYYGVIPFTAVIGRVLFRSWPLKHIGPVR